MPDKDKYLIETDILLDHLTTDEQESVLEKIMQKGICFTTVINSAELFYAAKNKFEKETVFKLLSSLKVLGLNSRYSLDVGKYNDQLPGTRDALIAVVAYKNKLKIISNNFNKFAKCSLEVINPKEI